MKILKLKFLIPVLAIVFALTSAFTTSKNTNVEDLAVSQQAYILNNNVCQAKVMCSPEGQYACTFWEGGQEIEAYGKEYPGATTCNVELRKNTP